MRKRIILGFFCLFLLASLFLASCSKNTTSTPVITPTHTGAPIITMDIQHIMQGKADYLSVYVDGYVIFKEDNGLRHPVAGHPPMRSWYTGQLTSGDLSTLIDFIRSSGFAAIPEQNNFATTPAGQTVGGDNFVTVAVSYGELQKTASAVAYLTYTDMPYPLNEIYTRLWNIAQSTTIVVTEVIT
jgi:hypothetical protein